METAVGMLQIFERTGGTRDRGGARTLLAWAGGAAFCALVAWTLVWLHSVLLESDYPFRNFAEHMARPAPEGTPGRRRSAQARAKTGTYPRALPRPVVEVDRFRNGITPEMIKAAHPGVVFAKGGRKGAVVGRYRHLGGEYTVHFAPALKEGKRVSLAYKSKFDRTVFNFDHEKILGGLATTLGHPLWKHCSGAPGGSTEHCVYVWLPEDGLMVRAETFRETDLGTRLLEGERLPTDGRGRLSIPIHVRVTTTDTFVEKPPRYLRALVAG